MCMSWRLACTIRAHGIQQVVQSCTFIHPHPHQGGARRTAEQLPAASGASRTGKGASAHGVRIRRAGERVAPIRGARPHGHTGRPPLRIDIMTGISSVSFEEAWRGRISARFDGHEVGFLGREQFIANKRASGRPKDLMDIALLEEVEE